MIKKVFNDNNSKIVIITVLLITVIILFGIGRLVTYNLGYISKKEPIDIEKNYEIKEPIGINEEINISECKNEYLEIQSIPNINNLQHKMYLSNESVKTLENDFKKRLQDDGYELIYEGTIFKNEIPLICYGFINGLNAVGIIMTTYQNLTSGHETLVLYTVGSVFDYKDIIDWYKESEDFLIDP